MAFRIASATISLQALHELPLREKLFFMEALWDDLSATESDLEVPAWQKEVLDVREEAVAAGTAKFKAVSLRHFLYGGG